MSTQEILKGLNRSEKEHLYKQLRKELGEVPQLEKIRSDQNRELRILCPHCDCADILGHGTYKGRKRYKCKGCHKTFNDFTGTAMSGLKKAGKFEEYLELVMASTTIREAAKVLMVSTRTIFDWRHKLLSSLAAVNGQAFSGIVECDDKQLDMSEKGSRNLGRESHTGGRVIGTRSVA